MWLADMDFASPAAVRRALIKRAEHGVYGYTNPSPELIETVISKVYEEHQWRIRQEWLVWLPGLVSGINVFCRAYGGEGDRIGVGVPAYPPFLRAAGNFNKTLVTWPLAYEKPKGIWSLNLGEMEETIDESCASVILCNPHNPTGRVFSRDELEDFAAICEKKDLIICSDEIHCGLVLDKDKKHIPLASLDEEIARRTVTLMAPSKTYNLPGLGCSFAIIPSSDLRRRFQRAMRGIVPHVNLFGYTATLAAYRDGGPWKEKLLEYLRENRKITQGVINDCKGVSMAPPQATYLAWIDCADLGLDNPAHHFERFGVRLMDGREFHGPGFMRMNFACPRSLLVEGLSRIKRAVNSVSE
jgi:cystathionine beta-lyase